MPSGLSVSFWSALVVAVTCASLFRVHQINHLRDQGVFVKYFQLADEILAGSMPPDRLGDVSPGYLWSIVLMNRMATVSPHDLRSAQILAIGAVALAAALVANSLGGRAAATFAALLVLANRAALVNAAEIEPETAILVLNSGALALLIAPAEGRGSWRETLGGAALGVSAVMRPVAFLPILGLAAWLTWDRVRSLSEASDVSVSWRLFPWRFLGGAFLPILAAFSITRTLADRTAVMDPGTVLYQGMNPRATGCGYVAPRVVEDIEAMHNQVYALHIAYRLVATRATIDNGGPDAANAYWTHLAISFAYQYPRAAIGLVKEKLTGALSSHDTYTVWTMIRKDRELARGPWAPYGVLVPFSLLGVLLVRGRRGIGALVIYALACGAVLPLFYVTARQRNPLLPAVASLAAVGVCRLAVLFYRRRLAVATSASLCAVIMAMGLGIESDAQREDDYAWLAAEQSARADADAASAIRDGRPARAAWLRAESATWLTEDEQLDSPELVRAAALQALKRQPPLERRFDLGVALSRAGDWTSAGAVFADLLQSGYRPLRGDLVPKSVSYQAARAFIHLGARDQAAVAIARAVEEAPGDASVLALLAEWQRDAGDDRAAHETVIEMRQLHDPFTVDEALARACIDMGRTQEAIKLIRGLRSRLPEWNRPRILEETIARGSMVQPLTRSGAEE